MWSLIILLPRTGAWWKHVETFNISTFEVSSSDVFFFFFFGRRAKSGRDEHLSLHGDLLLTGAVFTWPVRVHGGSVVRERPRSHGVSGYPWAEGGPCRDLQTEACWEMWALHRWSLLGMNVLPLAERDPERRASSHRAVRGPGRAWGCWRSCPGSCQARGHCS